VPPAAKATKRYPSARTWGLRHYVRLPDAALIAAADKTAARTKSNLDAQTAEIVLLASA
jgi:hypothetical protein